MPARVLRRGASVCNEGAGGDYSKPGPYGATSGVTQAGLLSPFTIVPTVMDGHCQHPAIVFSGGDFLLPFWYRAFLDHLASYGFIVVVDPSFTPTYERYQGGSMRSALDWLYTSAYAPILSPRAGASGHSGGACAAFRIADHPKVKAVVAIEPGQLVRLGMESSGQFKANRTAAYLGLTGAAPDAIWGDGKTDPKVEDYPGSVGVPKFTAAVVSADHLNWLANSTTGGGAAFAAAATAWFRCYLADDAHACSLFAGGTCKNLPRGGDQWTDCHGERLK